MIIPDPLDIVKQAHLETSGDKVANATAAELWLADYIRKLMMQLAGGLHRAGSIQASPEVDKQ